MTQWRRLVGVPLVGVPLVGVPLVGVPAVGVVGSALMLWGCAQTTQISEDLTGDRLQRAGKSVAVMRIGAASATCEHVAVLLGVRDGPGFRPSTWLKVYNVKSLSEPAVAEAVLAPGEYHLVAYQCASGKSVKGVDAKADAKSYGQELCAFLGRTGRGDQRRVCACGCCALRAKCVRARCAGECCRDRLAGCRVGTLQAYASENIPADADSIDDSNADRRW